MKHTLLIMRHAKSSWDDPALGDKERPLNPRGEHDAPMMGKRIQELGYTWNAIISSPALRAVKTAQCVADKVGYQKDIIFEEALYFQGRDAIWNVVEHLDESLLNVMLFAHNPDMHECYEFLCKKGIKKFPTAAYAIFETDRPWSEFQGFRELWYDQPKRKF
jgi:phosphohistidine phosphatase